MKWDYPTTFRVETPVSPWGKDVPVPVKPEWADDEEKKKLFGIELAKDHPSPFVAACSVFPDTSNALWASINWAYDPIVIAARDLYLKTLATDASLLDKNQFAATLLRHSEEKSLEGKDRVAFLKLYAEVMGFTGKVEINASTNYFNNNNQLKIILVDPDDKTAEKAATTIEHKPSDDFVPTPLKLKLV